MASQPPARTRTLLVGLLLAVSLHAFHAMAVVTVVPLVTEDLDGRALYGAVLSVYLLASLLGLVWAGRRVDAAGPAGPLAAGLGVFAAGLIGSGWAGSMAPLLAARALEGFGGGVATTVLYSAVNRAYPASERPRVLAWVASAWVLPGLLGPPLAGWIAETWSWRWVFLVVLPLVGLAAALALPPLRRLGAPSRPARDPGPSIASAVGLAVGLAVLLSVLARESTPVSLAAAAAGAALAGRAAWRLLPRGTLLARPGLPAAIATKLLLNFAFFGVEGFLPLALRDVRGFSPVEAGAVLTMGALAWTAGALLHARLAAHRSPSLTASAGAVAILLGFLGILVGLGATTPAALMPLVWACSGLGMGIAYNTTVATAMAATPAGSEGGTSAAIGVADALGFALSAGIGGAILAGGDRAAWPTTRSLATVIVVMGVAGIASLCTAAGLARRERAAPSRPFPVEA